jgi:hypothetical protein
MPTNITGANLALGAYLLVNNPTREDSPPNMQSSKNITFLKGSNTPLSVSELKDPDNDSMIITVKSVPLFNTNSLVKKQNNTTVNVNDTLTAVELSNLYFILQTSQNLTTSNFRYEVAVAGKKFYQTISFSEMISPVSLILNSPPRVDSYKTLSIETNQEINLQITPPTDLNNDVLTVESWTLTGGTLKRNGVIVTKNQTLSVTDLPNLSWIAPNKKPTTNLYFSYVVSDGVNKAIQEIEFNITEVSISVNPITSVTITNNSINSGSIEDVIVGSLQVNSGTGTVTYNLINTAGNRFKLVNGNILVCGATATDYALAGTHSITVRATNVVGNTDATFTIQVIDVSQATGVQVSVPATLRFPVGSLVQNLPVLISNDVNAVVKITAIPTLAGMTLTKSTGAVLAVNDIITKNEAALLQIKRTSSLVINPDVPVVKSALGVVQTRSRPSGGANTAWSIDTSGSFISNNLIFYAGGPSRSLQDIDIVWETKIGTPQAAADVAYSILSNLNVQIGWGTAGTGNALDDHNWVGMAAVWLSGDGSQNGFTEGPALSVTGTSPASTVARLISANGSPIAPVARFNGIRIKNAPVGLQICSAKSWGAATGIFSGSTVTPLDIPAAVEVGISVTSGATVVNKTVIIGDDDTPFPGSNTPTATGFAVRMTLQNGSKTGSVWVFNQDDAGIVQYRTAAPTAFGAATKNGWRFSPIDIGKAEQIVVNASPLLTSDDTMLAVRLEIDSDGVVTWIFDTKGSSVTAGCWHSATFEYFKNGVLMSGTDISAGINVTQTAQKFTRGNMLVWQNKPRALDLTRIDSAVRAGLLPPNVIEFSNAAFSGGVWTGPARPDDGDFFGGMHGGIRSDIASPTDGFKLTPANMAELTSKDNQFFTDFYYYQRSGGERIAYMGYSAVTGRLVGLARKQIARSSSYLTRLQNLFTSFSTKRGLSANYLPWDFAANTILKTRNATQRLFGWHENTAASSGAKAGYTQYMIANDPNPDFYSARYTNEKLYVANHLWEGAHNIVPMANIAWVCTGDILYREIMIRAAEGALGYQTTGVVDNLYTLGFGLAVDEGQVRGIFCHLAVVVEALAAVKPADDPLFPGYKARINNIVTDTIKWIRWNINNSRANYGSTALEVAIKQKFGSAWSNTETAICLDGNFTYVAMNGWRDTFMYIIVARAAILGNAEARLLINELMSAIEFRISLGGSYCMAYSSHRAVTDPAVKVASYIVYGCETTKTPAEIQSMTAVQWRSMYDASVANARRQQVFDAGTTYCGPAFSSTTLQFQSQQDIRDYSLWLGVASIVNDCKKLGIITGNFNTDAMVNTVCSWMGTYAQHSTTDIYAKYICQFSAADLVAMNNTAPSLI